MAYSQLIFAANNDTERLCDSAMIKKDSLIRGTVILAVAALVARFLGLFQRVPLDYMLGTEGQTAFGEANTIYLLLLIVATGGIPSAISKMVSQRYALGRPEEAKRIYHAGLAFGVMAGVLLATLLFVLAPYYTTHITDKPHAKLAVQAIAPALLMFPIIAMMRGYFQGRQLMMAGGISQIVEQILRVVVGIGLALVVLAWGWGDEWVAAAATFGSFIGGVGSLCVMLWYGRKLRQQDRMESLAAAAAERAEFGTNSQSAIKLPILSIYKEIFSISLPVVITSITVQFVYTFHTSLFYKLTGGFYSYEAAEQALSFYNIKAMSLAGIPPILAIALSASIIPVISSAYTMRNMLEVQRQISVVMRIVCFTGVPVALAMTVGAHSITGLIFKGAGGSDIVALLTAGTIFQITMMTSNSILLGLGKSKFAMVHTLVGLALFMISSIVLGNVFGIYGLIIASALCFIFITWLNLNMISGEVRFQVLGRRWPAYIAAIAIAAACGWGAELALSGLVSVWPDKLAYFVSASVTGCVIFGLYVILLAALRVITPEDVATFPAKLRKPLGMLLKPFYRRS